MTEILARFCNVCNKMADKGGACEKPEWGDKYYSNYWHSEVGDIIVCAACWQPLWTLLDEIGPEALAELIAELANPYEESRE